MTEIADFAAILLLVTGAVALAVVSTALSGRVPIPAPAIFLIAAAVVSDIWPQVYEHVPILTVERVAVVALVVILFNGGIDIGWARFRASAGPILSLGIVGTFATAGLLAVFAHVALGFDWTLAGIIGAALAPTDPAVMFSVLGRREIAGRSGTTLEGEAGVNDPAGIALMVGLIELATHNDASAFVVVREFVVEMGVGTAMGFAGALALLPLLRRLQLPAEGFYPVLALALAGALYSATSLVHGSGFLAVFIAGLVLGDARLPYKGEIERFHDLPRDPRRDRRLRRARPHGQPRLARRPRLGSTAALLLLVLALIARPLVVAATLASARLRWAERAFIGWSGLKGAVPILLAAFAVIGGVPGSENVYGIVFVVVLLSVVCQGTLVPLVARSLRIPMHEPPLRPWRISVGLGQEPGSGTRVHSPRRLPRREQRTEKPSARQEHLGDARCARRGSRRAPRLAPATVGDRVALLAEPEDSAAVGRLFRAPPGP